MKDFSCNILKHSHKMAMEQIPEGPDQFLGGSRGMPPRKCLKLDPWKCIFLHSGAGIFYFLFFVPRFST